MRKDERERGKKKERKRKKNIPRRETNTVRNTLAARLSAWRRVIFPLSIAISSGGWRCHTRHSRMLALSLSSSLIQPLFFADACFSVAILPHFSSRDSSFFSLSRARPCATVVCPLRMLLLFCFQDCARSAQAMCFFFVLFPLLPLLCYPPALPSGLSLSRSLSVLFARGRRPARDPRR